MTVFYAPGDTFLGGISSQFSRSGAGITAGEGGSERCASKTVRWATRSSSAHFDVCSTGTAWTGWCAYWACGDGILGRLVGYPGTLDGMYTLVLLPPWTAENWPTVKRVGGLRGPPCRAASLSPGTEGGDAQSSAGCCSACGGVARAEQCRACTQA